MTLSYSWRPALAFCACIATGAGELVAADLWIEDPITQCQVWTDKIDPAGEATSWTGDCLDGKATGQGVLVWFKGDSLLGRYRIKGARLEYFL